MEEQRSRRELTFPEIAAQLPGWVRMNKSQLAKAFRAERDLSLQEAREICAAIGTDLAEAELEVQRRLKAGVIPRDPRKVKQS